MLVGLLLFFLVYAVGLFVRVWRVEFERMDVTVVVWRAYPRVFKWFYLIEISNQIYMKYQKVTTRTVKLD